jgi:CBS domain containing-hemolysin-like protein
VEIAFISSNRLRIELDKKKGLFSAKIISIFINNSDKFLSTMLLGNNVALVIYGILMAVILEPVASLIFTSSIGIFLTQTIISTLLILITAEFLPKIVFRSVPNLTLNLFSIPSMLFYLIFYPITSFIVWLSDIIIKGLYREESSEIGTKQVFNKIDLIHLINQSSEDKNHEVTMDSNLKLFQNALDFSSVRVRDCMVPRTEIVASELNDSVEDLHQKFISTGFSKILIYKENIDNIVGYITSKTLLKNIRSVKDNLVDVPFVPEAMQAHRLLEKLIQEKKSLAVVVDEFGGVSGMLTIEDIIEEIFGEIEDEHDITELVEKQIGEQEFIFSGRLEIDYINEKYKLNIPESEDYETLAGFIFHRHENIPQLNEQIIIDSFSFKIIKVSKTKIELVRVKIITS